MQQVKIQAGDGVRLLYKIRNNRAQPFTGLGDLGNVNHVALVVTVQQNGQPSTVVLTWVGGKDQGWHIVPIDTYIKANPDNEIHITTAIPGAKGQKAYDEVADAIANNIAGYSFLGNNCAINSAKVLKDAGMTDPGRGHGKSHSSIPALRQRQR